MKNLAILVAVGLAMLVTGIVTIVWSGLILENVKLNMVGCIIGLVGITILTKEVKQS